MRPSSNVMFVMGYDYIQRYMTSSSWTYWNFCYQDKQFGPFASFFNEWVFHNVLLYCNKKCVTSSKVFLLLIKYLQQRWTRVKQSVVLSQYIRVSSVTCIAIFCTTRNKVSLFDAHWDKNTSCFPRCPSYISVIKSAINLLTCNTMK